MGLRSGGYAAVRGPFRREVAPDRLVILGGVRAAGRSIQALDRLQDHLARAADRVDRARAPVGPRAEELRRRDGRQAAQRREADRTAGCGGDEDARREALARARAAQVERAP